MSDISDLITLVSNTNAKLERLLEHVENTDKTVAAVCNDMWGKDGVPGVKTEVDRMKEKQKDRSATLVWIMGVVGLLGLDRLWDVIQAFFHHPKN
jgi:predicted MPP superfamily phosphohydrolase